MIQSALLAGKMMSEANAEAKRVEDTVLYMLDRSSYNVEVLAQDANILITLKDENENPFTQMVRIERHVYDLGKIDMVNSISRKVYAKVLSSRNAYEQLYKIKIHKEYSRDKWYPRFGILLLAPAFVLVFEGTLMELCITTLISILYTILWEIHKRLEGNILLHYLLSSLMISIVLHLLVYQFSSYDISSDIVMMSSIMPMVPGIGMTHAFIDILNRDYMSGLVRMMEALIQALSIASGIGFGLQLIAWLLK